jgi:predicted nucleotidyltransferase
MNIFQDEHIEVLNLLLDENVEFLIVGGFAVNFYGYRRSTGDVDLWLKPDNLNKSKLLKVFNRMDIEYTDIQHLESLDFETRLAFHIGEEPARIDFLTYISGVEWHNAWAVKTMVDIEKLSIPFIHKNHLIESKIMTGRAQDIADIEGLQNNADT